MAPFRLVMLVFFFVCEALATFNVPARVNLTAAGLAFYAASLFL